MSNPPTLHTWLAYPLCPLTKKNIDRVLKADDVRRIAIMPDAHAAEDVCIGAVIGTSQLIYPQAVGNDIGCGMSTIPFHGPPPDTTDARQDVLRALQRHIRVLTREPASAPGPDPEFLSDPSLTKAFRRDGTRELGTLGRGNHFVELQLDESGTLWTLVHSGSRAMGQSIARFHTSRAAPHAGLIGLDADSPQGCAYLNDAAWAVEFATASRRAILDDVTAALAPFGLTPAWDRLINNTHNMVARETYADQQLLVHRKGAATAHTNHPGVIPGSAGTYTVHVEGRGDASAMSSSSHGAGRAMSRTEARRCISSTRFEQEMQAITFDRRLSRRLVDESPSVYRDLRKVMAAQRDLVRTTNTLRPILSFKGV